MNVENKMNPKVNKLQVDDLGNVYAEIFDVELDPIRIDFNDDGCASINCEDYGYLTLDIKSLNTIIQLIELEKKQGQLLIDE